MIRYDDVVGKENLSAVERALAKRGLKPVSVAAFADRAKPDIEGGLKQVAAGQPDVVILTTLYKASADFIRLAHKSGMGFSVASNSFPGVIRRSRVPSSAVLQCFQCGRRGNERRFGSRRSGLGRR